MSIFQAWFTTESIRFRVRALKARFRDQKAEFDVIRQHLRPSDIACDIGAYKGSFIYWLSWWVHDGRVVAFEPQPDLARYLTNICRVLGLGKKLKPSIRIPAIRTCFCQKAINPARPSITGPWREKASQLCLCRPSRWTIIST